MKVLDANLLIYVYDLGSPRNEEATAWFEALLSSPESVGIPLQSVLAFLSVMTDHRLRTRMSIAQAIAIVDQWFEAPQVRLLVPGERQWSLLRAMILADQVTGSSISDAQIATMALECAGEVQSVDKDFRRFSEVRSRDSLAGN